MCIKFTNSIFLYFYPHFSGKPCITPLMKKSMPLHRLNLDKKSTQQGTQTQESTANTATAIPARYNALYFLAKVPCVRAVPSLNSPYLRNIPIRRHRLRRCRAVLWYFFLDTDMNILPFLFIPCKIDVHKHNGLAVLLLRFNVY